MDFLDRLLALIKMDRSSRWGRRYLREHPRYPELTRRILESISELEFDLAVVDYVSLKVISDYEHKFETVSQMSPGIQAVYSTWCVQAEVDNGGLYQFFYNKGVDWAFKALEGYRLLGAHKHAEVMARAIGMHLEEEREQKAQFSGGLLALVEDYCEARKLSKLPELEAQFPAAHVESVIALAFEYMKRHMDQFITC